MSLEPSDLPLRAHRRKQPHGRDYITSSELVALVRESDIALNYAKRVMKAANELKCRTKRMLDEMGI